MCWLPVYTFKIYINIYTFNCDVLNSLGESILLDIMFHAPMGRFQNNLFLLPIFPPSSHSMSCFHPIGLWSLMRHFYHPKRPVENVALTTKGLQERKHNIEWNDVGKIGNKNKQFHWKG